MHGLETRGEMYEARGSPALIPLRFRSKGGGGALRPSGWKRWRDHIIMRGRDPKRSPTLEQQGATLNAMTEYLNVGILRQTSTHRTPTASSPWVRDNKTQPLETWAHSEQSSACKSAHKVKPVPAD